MPWLFPSIAMLPGKMGPVSARSEALSLHVVKASVPTGQRSAAWARFTLTTTPASPTGSPSRQACSIPANPSSPSRGSGWHPAHEMPIMACERLRTCAWGPAPLAAGPAPAPATAREQDRDKGTSGPGTQVPGTKVPASQGRPAPVPTETARVLAVVEWSL
jgi:hypothetical protein